MKNAWNLPGKAIVASVSGIVSNLAFAHSEGGWGHHMDGWMMGSPGTMVVIVGVFVLAIYGFKQWNKHHKPPAPPEKTALQLLDEAYARGDIDRDQFMQKRDDLKSK